MLNIGSISYTLNDKTELFQNEEKKIDSPFTDKNILNLGEIKNETGDKILVLHEKERNGDKFTFYDNEKGEMGSFTIVQLIKYLMKGDAIIKENKLNQNKYQSYELIKKLICVVNIKNDKMEIKMLSYLESPMMGNIEMLIKMLNSLRDYQNNILNIEIKKVKDKNLKNKITISINKFNYMLMNHMLKLISAILEEIKDDMNKKSIKEQLIKYSININQRMNAMMNNEIIEQTERNNIMNDNLIRLLEVKEKIRKRVYGLEEKINEQNTKIDHIINNISKTTQIVPNNTKKDNISEKNGGSNGSSSSSMSIIIDNKIKKEFGCDNIEQIFDDSENNYESDNENKDNLILTNSEDSLESIVSRVKETETMSHISGIYKVEY